MPPANPDYKPENKNQSRQNIHKQRTEYNYLIRHNAKLLALVSDKTYLLVSDLFVYLMNSGCDCETPPKKSADAQHPRVKTP